jgi:cellulose biosynthesis protein BcsQ
MKIVACYNIKGGVGKTAAAVNLAWLAARDSLVTLIWDLDPQGAATFYFRSKPKVKGGGRGLIAGDRDLQELIHGTEYPLLDILPADFSYRHMDIRLEEKKQPTRRLRKLLKPLAGTYDLVILDCAPSISLVSEAVFEAADIVLVPLIPTTLSLRTLEQLQAFRSRRGLDGLQLLPFFSMVDRRKTLHRDILEQLPGDCPELLNTHIPYASEVEQMGVRCAPVVQFAAGSRSGLAFEALWAELRAHLQT